MSQQAVEDSIAQNAVTPPSLRKLSSGDTLNLTAVLDDASLSIFSKDTLTRYVERPAGQAVCPRPATATNEPVMHVAQAESQIDLKKAQSSYAIQSRSNTTVHSTVTPKTQIRYNTTMPKRQTRNVTATPSLSMVSKWGGSKKRHRANGSQKVNVNKRREVGEANGPPASPFKVRISDLGSNTWATSPHNSFTPLLHNLAKEWESGHYRKWRTTESLEACLTMKCRKVKTTRKQADTACVACESAGRPCATVREAGSPYVFPLRNAVRTGDRGGAGYWVLSG